MMKKLLPLALLLCCTAAILLTVLVIHPHQTHAAAPAPVLSVYPQSFNFSNCTPVSLASNSDTSTKYQACTVHLTTSSHLATSGLHWSISYTSKFCYLSCSAYTSHFAILGGTSGTLTYSGEKQQVVILTPIDLVEGSVQATFLFTGPGNTIRVASSF